MGEEKKEQKEKKIKDGFVKFLNSDIEKYFASVAITNIRNCKSASASSKHKIFQVSFELTESAKAKAYRETKKDLFDREGEEVEDERQQQMLEPSKQIIKDSNPEGYAELVDFMNQDSGIEIQKPNLAMDDFQTCSEIDFTGSAWVFNWFATQKEIRELEKPKKPKKKN